MGASASGGPTGLLELGSTDGLNVIVPNTMSTGNGSELVVGDYPRLIIARRMEPQFRLLSERYAAHGQFGLSDAI